MDSKRIAEVKIDLDDWVNQIKDGLKVEKDEVMELSVSVFGVPKELLAAKPKAFIPQSISIGPYHHWRSELYEMERYKLVAARRFQQRIPTQKFESIAEELRKYEWQIRSCYHKYLDYNEESLAWLMALDGSFVLECLQFYVKQADETASSVSSEVKQLGKVLDPTGRSAIHNEIMQDLMMLENQIPLFVLQKLLEMQLSTQDIADERLFNLVRLACKELSPFKFAMPDDSKLQERGHLLEVLYYCIVPAAAMDATIAKGDGEKEKTPPDVTRVRKAFSLLWKLFSILNVGPIKRLTALPQRLLQSRAVQIVIKLPLRLLSALGNLPVLSVLKGPLSLLFKFSSTDKTEKDGDGESSSMEIPPTRDELAIPSVADLHSAGVKLLPSDGDLTSIHFDQKTATLYLPKVRLDANSEVILRNLVAYEASAAPGALIFTRYTDFMNGLIDNEEDVRLLRNSGIVSNYLESDVKVASLWNGMGKCVKLTKVKYLDQVIADVNKHYNRRWGVAAKEYVRKYIFGSWQVLSLLAAVMLLAFTCLEAFCTVYDCKRWLEDTTFLQEET